MNASNERTKVRRLCTVPADAIPHISYSTLTDGDVVVLDDLMRGLGIPGSEARPKDDVIELKPPAAFFLAAVHSQIMRTLTALMEMNGFRQGKDTAERED